MSDLFDEDRQEPTPEGAAFLVDAIGGLVGDWGKTNWIATTNEILALVCEDKFEEVDRRLAAVDVTGPSLVVFGHLTAAHPASHHLHEFEPLLIRAATMFEMTPDELLQDIER